MATTPRWRRAAILGAAAWLAAGAGMSALASSAPDPDAIIPQLLGWGALLVGWPIGRWFGRRAGLRTRGEWARLAAGMLATVSVGIGFAACAAAIATYG